jgi:hypothetical protein
MLYGRANIGVVVVIVVVVRNRDVPSKITCSYGRI